MYVRTSDRLGQATPIKLPRQANRGSPEYIRWMQQALNQILGLRLKVDGLMGPQTRSAIRSFQQKQRLVADGIVGPKTQAALSKATGGAAPGPVITPPTTDIVKSAAARLTQFDKNSAKLKDFHAPEIDRVADRVVETWKTGQPIFTIYVKGHTSSEGPAQYNISLGNQRALAVRKALQKALERKQKNLSYRVLILTQSKGAKEPIDTNETEEGRSQNRRVEIFLSTKALLPLPKPKPTEEKPKIPWIIERPEYERKPEELPEKCDQAYLQKLISDCNGRYAACGTACYAKASAEFYAKAGMIGGPCAAALGTGNIAGAIACAAAGPPALGFILGEVLVKLRNCSKECVAQRRTCVEAAKKFANCP